MLMEKMDEMVMDVPTVFETELDLETPFDMAEDRADVADMDTVDVQDDAPIAMQADRMHEVADVTDPEEKAELLREVASEKLAVLNAAYATDSVTKIKSAKEAAKEAIDRYNEHAQCCMFDLFLADDAPILAAIRQGFWSVLTLKEKTESDGIQTAGLDYITRTIDLQRLVKRANGRKITPVTRWESYAEKIAFLFAINATKNIGGDAEKLIADYKISEHGRKLSMDDVNKRKKSLDSVKALTDALQTALDAVLYIGDGKYNALKVTSHDVYYILYTVFRKGKNPLTVAMPRASTMITAVTEVGYRLVNGLCYDAEYESIEKKAA